MARKKRKKHSWRQTLLIFVGVPLAVWFLAFIVWLFWPALQGPVKPDKTAARSGASSAQVRDRAKGRERETARPPREDIPEEDRKKLDDLLEQR